MTESVAPTAAGTTPFDPANLEEGIAKGKSISVTFSEAMDPSTFTTHTSTTCSGSFQVSTDSDFSAGTCVKMSSSTPSASNDNKTFTVDPLGKLSGETWYHVKITIQVKDPSGNNLTAQIEFRFKTAT